MSDQETRNGSVTRRDFLLAASAGTLAMGSGLGMVAPAVSQATGTATTGAVAGGAPANPAGYNILFILTDQERLFRPGELPAGFSLPGHERLLRTGTLFTNHTINS